MPHKDFELPIHVFEGEIKADFTLEKTYEWGAESVEIIEAEAYILVVYYNGKREKIKLIIPHTDQELTLDKI